MSGLSEAEAIRRLRERSARGDVEADLAAVEAPAVEVPAAEEAPVEVPAELRPVVDRLAVVAGPDDDRPSEAVLGEIGALAGAVVDRLDAQALARRQGEAWQQVERLRLSVASGRLDVAPRLAKAVEGARRALGVVEEAVPVPACERVLARSGQVLAHVPTGLPSIDAATRGGPLASRLHVIAGEPDAGKTALAVQIGLYAARLGYAVLWYAVDEPRAGIEDRIGQAHGLALEDLEAGHEGAIAYLSRVLRDLPQFQIADQEEDGLTVEDAAQQLAVQQRRLAAPGAVLIVDSIQTARCRASASAQRPMQDRERIEAVTAALKAAARTGALVWATSETGRSSYRARSIRDRTAELAAAKGSGAIEFAAMTLWVLSRIGKGEHAGDVRVGVAKNKRGEATWKSGSSLRLERDPDRCTYFDRGRVDQGEEPEERESAPKRQVSEESLEPYCARVRKALAGMPQGFAGGRDDLAKLAGGKASMTRAAIALLITRRELIPERPEGEPARLRLRGAADVPEATSPTDA